MRIAQFWDIYINHTFLPFLRDYWGRDGRENVKANGNKCLQWNSIYMTWQLHTTVVQAGIIPSQVQVSKKISAWIGRHTWKLPLAEELLATNKLWGGQTWEATCVLMVIPASMNIQTEPSMLWVITPKNGGHAIGWEKCCERGRTGRKITGLI